MTNQEILDNAPEGATEVGAWYYKTAKGNIPFPNGIRNHEQKGSRSLADIKRIAALEGLVKAVIQYDDCDTAGQSRKAQEWMIKLAKQLKEQDDE